MQTELNIDLIDVLDEAIYKLRRGLAPHFSAVAEEVANELQAELDHMILEPSDVMDLRHALRPLGYEAFGPMLPKQHDYFFLLGVKDFVKVMDCVTQLQQNSGLTVSISTDPREKDMQGIPYINLVVARA